MNQKTEENIAIAIGLGALLYVGVRQFRNFQRSEARSRRGPSFAPSVRKIPTHSDFGELKNRDVVDQASWESMDCSDAPAY